MLKIACIYYPKCLLTSINAPLDILKAAAATYKISHPEKSITFDILDYELDRPIHDENLDSIQLKVKRICHKTRYDLIILPAIWRNPLPLINNSSQLISWLKAQHQQKSYICAVGTANFFLAETQLLNNRVATTHWSYLTLFEKKYPSIKIQRNHLITHSNRMYCASSINSIADVSVYFCELFFGKKIAAHIESQFSPEVRQPIHDQWFSEEDFKNSTDEIIRNIQIYIEDNFAENTLISKLPNQFGLSQRTINRRFKAALNITPHQYLQHLRLNTAKSLLKYSNLSIEEIAHQSGYCDSSYFIKKFKQTMNTTPVSFRYRIRKKVFHL
jgi:transcriptional regulator GlxA family with amidase domain